MWSIGVFAIFFLKTCASANAPQCTQTRFFHNPDDCSKYFLCLDGEIFEFQCSEGLLFDENRQTCDQRSNCAGATAACRNATERACADGTCLPAEYFCDGSDDCLDGSDEKCGEDDHAAGECDEDSCKLPSCFCSKTGKEIPGNLNPDKIPQMILLTFEDGVSYDTRNILTKEIFAENRRNPNGCGLRATFFISHHKNDYQQTQKLWNDGHEIAVHSVTHGRPENWTLEDWFDEMIGQANIVSRFANVRAGDIRGMRAPYLEIGGNRQYLMMKEFGFVYDGSIEAPPSDVPFWPYTLDYKIPHKCENQTCPTRSYKGLWEMVINEIPGLGYILEPSNSTAEETLHLLIENFQRHYYTNKAPLGLHIPSAWLEQNQNIAVLKKFVDVALKHPDVWFVTNWQAIQWMREPTTSQNPQMWSCDRRFEKREIACEIPNVCNVGLEKPFYTCSECPKTYPWFRNEFGENFV